MSKVLFVEYCAKDILDGTQNMDAITELAYRRIIDMIYSTNDKLLDNDSLKYATKTGAKWKKIRKELIEVHKKIYIEDGFIRNKKCSEKLQKSSKNIEQKSQAGKASAKSRKSLKDNETGSTAVDDTVETAEPTDVPTNQEPKDPIDKKEKNTKKEKSFEVEFENQFWPIALKKVKVATARRAYCKAREQAEADEIITAWQRANDGWAELQNTDDWQFVPHPASWLNAESWKDQDCAPPKIDTMEDLPEWKRAIGKDLGAAFVRSWFQGADLQGATLKCATPFNTDYVRGRHATDLKRHGIENIICKDGKGGN